MSMKNRSKTPPKSEARALGTKSKSGQKSSMKLVPPVSNELSDETQKDVATESPVAVSSTQNESASVNDNNTSAKDTKNMEQVTLTRKASNAKSGSVQYGIEGRRGSVRFSKSLFETAPDSITLDIDGLVQPKVRETKEERRARLKNAPKKTAAEKVAAMEARLARAKAKLEAGAGQ